MRYDIKFVKFFNNNKNPLAHLLCQQSKFYITLILITGAYYQRITLALHGNDSMKFRFRTRFKTEVELTSVTDNLFDDRLHLINLNRINNEILAGIVILLSGLLETTACFFNPVIKNIRKPE